jgi:hypothetical protein
MNKSLMKKSIIAAIALGVFIIFFAVGYRFGLNYAKSVFPEPEEKWEKEETTALETGTAPDVVKQPDGTWRMYYVVKEGIVSASSQDGKKWTLDEGVRVAPGFHSKDEAKIGGPAVITLKKGGYRMIYEASDEKQTTFLLRSAKSADGVSWDKEPGVRVKHVNRFDEEIAAAPDVVKTGDEEWRVYYSDGDTIQMALSKDEGLTWKKRSIKGLPEASLDPTVVLMSDGMYRMYFAVSQSDERLLKAKIKSARSENGYDWTVESGYRVVADPKAVMVLDPDVVNISLGKMKMFYSQLDRGVINGTGVNEPQISIRAAGLELK